MTYLYSYLNTFFWIAVVCGFCDSITYLTFGSILQYYWFFLPFFMAFGGPLTIWIDGKEK